MKRASILTVTLIASAVLVGVGCETMYVDPDAGGAAGSADYVLTGRTESFFAAHQVDPRSEDSAGPQLVAAADLDGDGMMDLATIWNETQPVQIHIQRRDERGDSYFLTVPIAGTTPIARASGLRIADMDEDGRLDLVVLVKDAGVVAICDVERDDCDPTDDGGVIDGALWGGLIIFYNPEDSIFDIWDPVILNNSWFAGTDGDIPEEGGYTGLDVGEIDGQLGPDIVVAFNTAEGDPPLHRIDLYLNPGNAGSRSDNAWDNTTVFQDLPIAKSVAVHDVDRDGDNDIIATYPDAKPSNVFWLPNPLMRNDEVNLEAVANPVDWNIRAPLGHVYTNADTIAISDVDGDGLEDVVVRSTNGRVVQWFKAPQTPSTTFIRNPWQVYTLAEFLEREPQGMAVGDVTGDGQVDAVVSAEGAVVWFDASTATSVYDHWTENLIIDEEADADTSGVEEPETIIVTSETGDPVEQILEEEGTFINALLIVDIDGDGWNDIIGTIDRNELSGLADDALVWFENLRN
jgi:hypothetical protein